MPYDREHFRVERFRDSTNYSPPRRNRNGDGDKKPARGPHGRRLQARLQEAFATALDRLGAPGERAFEGRRGVYLEVSSLPGERLPELNWSRRGIRLGALREDPLVVREVGSLFVPAEAREFLTDKVREYTEEDTPAGVPRHEDKFAPLANVSAGDLTSLWTDQRPLTEERNRPIWWECWCWHDRAAHLQPAADRLGLRVSEQRLYFPELVVVPVHATRDDIDRLLRATDAIEEVRFADDSPCFFTRHERRNQHPWVDDLVDRVDVAEDDAPVICILDTGVSRAHPLLENSLQADRCLTVDPAWGTDDHDPEGHGTCMAGVSLFGDLTYPLSDQRQVLLDANLESVKLLPPPGHPRTEPSNYGTITQAAVAVAEQVAPDDLRVFSMAVTNRDVSGERPTSWSAALDQICAGVMPGDLVDGEGQDPDEADEAPARDEGDGEIRRRLFIVAAGNVPATADPDEVADLDEFPIEDPAQAWNALTIGGFTDKARIDPADGLNGWRPVAAAGDHSPYSRISTDWTHSITPIKPEIVFEAGNLAISPQARELVSGVDSLSLLSTNKDFATHAPCVPFWATSAATAQAASMAASIMARHPDLWPETVRALLVHSADYTPAMRGRLAADDTKRAHIALARTFGYGVPRLERALASAGNDVALIAEAYIQPYKRERLPDNEGRLTLRDPTYNEIHYYRLPWPRRTLQDLAERDVRLKVTLSYFVEPNPGEGAPVRPLQYQSFGLRFDLKRQTDGEAEFRARINRLDRVEAPPEAEADSRWLFGSQSVAAGSLHSDVWTGPAAALANRDMLAIYPVGGWWRDARRHGRVASRARYSLVITITADDANVDLYAEIAAAVAARAQQVVEVRV